MTSPDTFVSVDVETTGLNPAFSEIIEIGAVKVERGKITAEYSQLVKPQRSIPGHITHLTGISDNDVTSKPPIDEIISDFLDFIKGFKLLGQNVSFDVSFLRKPAGIGNIRKAIDNIELARILLPKLPSYSLDSLIDFFALNPEKRHRALDDARVTAVIFLKLINMLRMTSQDFLNEMMKISTFSGSILQEVFEALTLERSGKQEAISAKAFQIKPGMTEKSGNIFGDFTQELAPPPSPGEASVDAKYVAKQLDTGGMVSKQFSAYEKRSGQIALSKQVARAFNDSEILLTEAGTGTGKSIAYLLPAILWANAAGERVVISTNTKNLQEQLFFNEIPLLSKVLDFPFRAVILKGRGNYICLNRWQRLIDSPVHYISKKERALMLPVASWLLETTTGDISETGFFSLLLQSGLLDHINSDITSCLGARCALREKCFVNRIRKAAQRSHIIIVNHSLVFSDMVSDGGVLGGYTRIVFDEAHNLEKTALRFLGVTMNYYSVRRVLNHLYSKNEQVYGVLVMLRKWVGNMGKGWPEFAKNAATVENAVETVQYVHSITNTLFKNLNTAVLAQTENKEDSPEGKLRYFANSPVFDMCKETISEFSELMTALIRVLEEVYILVSSVSSNHLHNREDILIDIEKSRQYLKAIIDEFAFLVEASGRNVFWFEYNPNAAWASLKINSAPLDIAEKLAVGLYDHMETVIMTSATLTVARDFFYIRERLGLNLDTRERVTEFIASSPFDYQRQSAVVIPAFLPSPKKEDFIERANEVLLSIARDVRRGMLVLFTSKGHLQRSYYELKDMFDRHGITLMGQGIDGSRNLLLRRFREEKSSVLFGTDSFWEGVDVPGSALELVVIVRLPFAVPTEPIIQAQMDEIKRAGGQPFMEYSVPEAAIKLRQGAGRLIRHCNDQGAVIVLDTRIVTTKYGSIFRRCLPGTSIRVDNEDLLTERLNKWFERNTGE